MSVIFPSEALVVDDEPVVLQVVNLALKGRGLRVTTVPTGEAAIEALSARSYGCVLTDKNLPGMDGIELIRRACRLRPYCALIVMTAYPSTQSAVEALRVGATDYIEKPFDNLELLAAKVERAIAAKRLAMERDDFADRMRSYQSQLDVTAEQFRQARSVIDVFEQVLDLRVRQATEDLRKDLDQLRRSVESGDEPDQGTRMHAQMLLVEVRELQMDPNPKLDPARYAFARLAKRIETHFRLTDRPNSGEQHAPSSAR